MNFWPWKINNKTFEKCTILLSKFHYKTVYQTYVENKEECLQLEGMVSENMGVKSKNLLGLQWPQVEYLYLESLTTFEVGGP